MIEFEEALPDCIELETKGQSEFDFAQGFFQSRAELEEYLEDTLIPHEDVNFESISCVSGGKPLW